jgi:hypothetical protein
MRHLLRVFACSVRASRFEQPAVKVPTTVLRGSRSCGRGPVLLVNTSSSTSHEVGSCRCWVQLRSSAGDKHVGSPYALISTAVLRRKSHGVRQL